MAGGSFQSGFLTAGVTSALGEQIGRIQSVGGQVVAAAVLGGVTNRVSGGSFANGAITAAFVHAYNEMNHKEDLRIVAKRRADGLGTELDVTIYNGDEIIYEGEWYNAELGTGSDIYGKNSQIADGSYTVSRRVCATCRFKDHPAISNTGTVGEVASPSGTIKTGIVMHNGGGSHHSNGCLVARDMNSRVIPALNNYQQYRSGQAIPLNIYSY